MKLKIKEIQMVWIAVIIHSVILFCICNFSKALETYRDELIYFNIAKCLANGTEFTVHGIEQNFVNIAYPLLISPFWGIKDAVLRMHLISLLNSCLMSLSIVPVWLICKEFQVGKKIRWFIIIIIMIYPSMLMAATFMAENLYWPLTLFTYYFIVRTEKYKKTLDALAAGILSFFCYFCKEVGVCIFLTAVVWFIISPVDLYFFERKNEEEGNFLRYYWKHLNWKNLFAYVFIFVIAYLIINKLFLSTVKNSYGGVVETVFSFLQKIDRSKIIYILYAIIVYILYAVIAFFVIPIMYPMLDLKSMNTIVRKMYLYTIILFIGTILTIVCTITVIEDLGNKIPRVHMRYFASMIGLILPVYGSLVSSKKHNIVNKKLWIFLGVFFIFSVFIFKGAIRGSTVDSFELQYAIYLNEKYGIINVGELSIYVSGIICNIFLGLIIIIGYIFYKKKLEYINYYFYTILLCVCVLNSQKAYDGIKGSYSVSDIDIDINNMCQINDYFIENNLENKNVMFVCENWYTKKPKVYDTYFTGSKTYEVSYASFLNILRSIHDNKDISVCNFMDPIGGQIFQLDSIEYFIISNEVQGFEELVGNIAYIESISSESYSVYQNINPMNICYLDPVDRIDLTGKSYSTLNYDIEGISIPEGTFSWTEGNEVIFFCNLQKELDHIEVLIDVAGTYNGEQAFTIYQNNTEISRGSISGSGQINFNISINEGVCSFKMVLPNAVSPYMLGESADKRVLALAISSICFSEK